MGFPRQEYWSGLLFLFAGDLSNLGIQLNISWIGRQILCCRASKEAQIESYRYISPLNCIYLQQLKKRKLRQLFPNERVPPLQVQKKPGSLVGPVPNSSQSRPLQSEGGHQAPEPASLPVLGALHPADSWVWRFWDPGPGGGLAGLGTWSRDLGSPCL